MTHLSSVRRTRRSWPTTCALTLLACTVIASCNTNSLATPDTQREAACAGRAPTDWRSGVAGGVRVLMVPPRLTDACIAPSTDSHVVFRPEVPISTPRLVLFLGGTGSAPKHYQLFLKAAADAGYHAVGLVYPNAVSVSVRCAFESAQCYEDTRDEVLTGRDRSAVLQVDRTNSIEHRLLRTLTLLMRRDAAGDWRSFIEADSSIAWARTSVAGHSQGGGFALFIAQRHLVLRASTYASYGDHLPTDRSPAPWVTRPYNTPPDRLSGFISSRDDGIAAPIALETWRLIGMAGDIVDVDRSGPIDIAGRGRRFVTQQAPKDPHRTVTPHHDIVILDAQTPLAVGRATPVFLGVWQAMSFGQP